MPSAYLRIVSMDADIEHLRMAKSAITGRLRRLKSDGERLEWENNRFEVYIIHAVIQMTKMVCLRKYLIRSG